MGTNIQIGVESEDAGGRLRGSKSYLNTERGIFSDLSDLIKLENNLIWDPIDMFFALTGGYRIYKYSTGGGAVFDQYDQEIFLTDKHIDDLFDVARMRIKQLSRGR